jgi:hypothetical protein
MPFCNIRDIEARTIARGHFCPRKKHNVMMRPHAECEDVSSAPMILTVGDDIE